MFLSNFAYSKFSPPINPLLSLLCPTTSIGSPFLAVPRSTRPVTIVPLSVRKNHINHTHLYMYLTRY